MSQTVQPFLLETMAVRASEALPDVGLRQLQATFGVSFALLDGHRGELIQSPPELAEGDWLLWSALATQVALRGKAEIIDERESAVLLAIPLADNGTHQCVAAAAFLTRPLRTEHAAASLADMLGISPQEARHWAQRQRIWTAEALLRLAATVQDKSNADKRAATLGGQVEALSVHLAETYEEIALLYRLTENLRLSEGVEEIGGRALEWLLDVLPAEGVAVEFCAATRLGLIPGEVPNQPEFLVRGEFPYQLSQFTHVVQNLGHDLHRQPVVLNAPHPELLQEAMGAGRNLVVAPLSSGGKTYGYLAAANHESGGEFGTVEARLLGSVATILGIHCGNIVLYREQAELFAGVVRALSSAIDAKDPYTCGHSDRVARVAMRLGEELGLSSGEQRTLHLAGLLHDVGKIGVKDEVLRKPGKLTPEEYEHIKLHPALGYEILRGLKKIEQVLPAVLHHHESWDGTGYPHGLAGEDIPFIARIVAVADAFDAMGSDRPYRKGMDDAALDKILHEGAGKQWDARIITAFFRARNDIREISRRERENLRLDLQPL